MDPADNWQICCWKRKFSAFGVSPQKPYLHKQKVSPLSRWRCSIYFIFISLVQRNAKNREPKAIQNQTMTGYQPFSLFLTLSPSTTTHMTVSLDSSRLHGKIGLWGKIWRVYLNKKVTAPSNLRDKGSGNLKNKSQNDSCKTTFALAIPSIYSGFLSTSQVS